MYVLSDDVLNYITEFLEFDDIYNLSLTSKRFRNLMKNCDGLLPYLKHVFENPPKPYLASLNRAYALLDNLPSAFPIDTHKIVREELYNRSIIIPDSIVMLQRLEELYILDGEIKYISPRISELPNLRKIYISNFISVADSCECQYGKDSLSELGNHYLYSENKPTSTKYEPFKSQIIYEYDAFRQYGNLKSVPIGFLLSESLTELTLHNCDIRTSVHENMASKLIQNSLKSNLEHLDLSENRIDSLPSQMAILFPKLTRLNLFSCRLTKLPDSLPENLNIINLSNNFLSTIPDSVVRLQNLEKLDLTGNALIREVPSGLVDLKYLRKLKLKGTKVRRLPNNLSNTHQRAYTFKICVSYKCVIDFDYPDYIDIDKF